MFIAARTFSLGLLLTTAVLFLASCQSDFRLWYPVGVRTLVRGRLYPDAPVPRVVELPGGVHLRRPDGWLMRLLQEYQWRGVPVVVRGAASDWPAVSRWTSSYIAEQVGSDSEITLQTCVQEQNACPFVRTTMGAYARWLDAHPDLPSTAAYNARREQSSAYYISEEFDFIDHYAGMVEDVRSLRDFWVDDQPGWWATERTFGGLLQGSSRERREGGSSRMRAGDSEEHDDDDDSERSSDSDDDDDDDDDDDGGGTDSPSRQIDERKGSRLETAFWMGGAGARSGWHYDADYGMNVLVHLRGTKNITLAPPSQTPRLYPSPRFDPGATLSLVDFWAPDEGTYPLYSSIRTQTLTIQPGDVLLIPAGWWHAVESSSVSVSLSVRYMDMVENAVNYVDRWKEYLHEKGLYGSKKDCVCHSERVVQRHDLE